MTATGAPKSFQGFPLNQERIVFAIAVLLFAGFSVFLRGFLNADNILSLIQNVSILRSPRNCDGAGHHRQR